MYFRPVTDSLKTVNKLPNADIHYDFRLSRAAVHKLLSFSGCLVVLECFKLVRTFIYFHFFNILSVCLTLLHAYL